MGMTDSELRYWLARGPNITDATPMAGSSIEGEIQQMWLVVAELGRRVLGDQQGTPEGA